MQDVVISGEKKVKDFLNTIQELCGENYIWVLTGAVVLAVLIIAAAAGAAIKAFRRKKTDSVGTTDTDREYFLEGEYDELLKQRASDASSAPDTSDTSHAVGISECCESEEYAPENEFESLSEQPVCININIERGQVKIDYGDDRRVSCSVETERGKPEEAEAQTDTAGREIVMEKINLIKGVPSRKFGPGNLNTGRSGRVYTEEELRRQIKE